MARLPSFHAVLRSRLVAGIGATAAACALVGLAAPTGAAAAGCAPPVPSTTQPGYTIADPHCDVETGAPFGPLTNQAGHPISTVWTGIAFGSAYRIEVPNHWNGELVLWAHGYRGTGTTVWVDSPQPAALRSYFVHQGFAWAASSYETNGYDVAHGVTDTHLLIRLFSQVTHRHPRDEYMSGESMGGQVTAVEIEHYPHTFVGAMPYCGVLGDSTLFSYFLDANVTAAALTNTTIRYPNMPERGQAYTPTYDTKVASELPKLGVSFTSPVPSTHKGRQWEAAVEMRSGGIRPGFDSAMAYWNSFGFPPLTNVPFLFGLYPGLTGGTIGIAPGNVASNVHTVYQLNANPALNPAERRLNADVLRVRATVDRPGNRLTGIPVVHGTPGIPVLSVHGIGDLFVPFSMEQIYAQRVARHGQSNLFVSRAIRENAHCGYTGAELTTAFHDLVHWVRTGVRPAGDNILDPRVVASPTFGCRFTQGPHPEFRGVPCPKHG